MNRISLKTILLTTLAISAALAAYQLTPRVELAQVMPAINLSEQVPAKIGGWTMDTRPVQVIENPEQSALLKSIYSDLMTRTYVNAEGEQMMVSLAYGRRQGDQVGVHYPEVCYPAQGFKLRDKRVETISVNGEKTSVTRLIAARDARNESITYMVLVGDKLVGSGREVKIEQIKNGFKGFISDGLLIRVSMIEPSGTGVQEAQWDKQARFLEQFLNSVDGGLRNRLTAGWSGKAIASVH